MPPELTYAEVRHVIVYTNLAMLEFLLENRRRCFVIGSTVKSNIKRRCAILFFYCAHLNLLRVSHLHHNKRYVTSVGDYIQQNDEFD